MNMSLSSISLWNPLRYEECQNTPPQNTSLWPQDYFELKILKKQHMQEGHFNFFFSS